MSNPPTFSTLAQPHGVPLRCHTVVPCAGVGQRALQPGHALAKQYQMLERVPLVVHTLKALDLVDVDHASGGAWHAGSQVAVLSPGDDLWPSFVAPLVSGWLAAPVGGLAGPSRC
ncbi:hypothetical protein LN050_04235 [Comamonadaceae bacterium M7527]|nr:hypothetical protein LN050_04235 [Comamonadaceae bacterium M7527]